MKRAPFLQGMSGGMSKLAAALGGARQMEQGAYDAEVGNLSKMEQALAKAREDNASAAQKEQAALAARERPDRLLESIAAQFGSDVPTVRSERERIRTGLPQVIMQGPTEDGLPLRADLQIAPELRTNIGRALSQFMPLSGNQGDMAAGDWAKALETLQGVNNRADIIGGKLESPTVGRAYNATAGRGEFKSMGNYVGNEFTGAVDMTAPVNAPKPAAAPASVQEYEFARSQGFKGSYQDWTLSTKRAGATNVSVNTAPKAFWGDLGKQQSEAFFKEREAAGAAGNIINSIGEIRKAAAGGAYQGAGADLKLGAAKVLGAIGMPYDEKTVANSEVFDAQAKSFVLASIKQLGANPSNQDLVFINKTVPQLSTDPSALPRLLEFMEKKARGSITSYNTKARQVQADPSARGLPFDLGVPEPPAASEIDALVNQYGGKK